MTPFLTGLAWGALGCVVWVGVAAFLAHALHRHPRLTDARHDGPGELPEGGWGEKRDVLKAYGAGLSHTSGSNLR